MRPGALLRQFGVHAKVCPIGLCEEKERHFVIMHTSHIWYRQAGYRLGDSKKTSKRRDKSYEVVSV
jgi:hypothetical protein